jgi:hypothetical protein
MSIVLSLALVSIILSCKKLVIPLAPQSVKTKFSLFPEIPFTWFVFRQTSCQVTSKLSP